MPLSSCSCPTRAYSAIQSKSAMKAIVEVTVSIAINMTIIGLCGPDDQPRLCP